MERYLQKDYIIKALKFYNVTKIDRIIKILEVINSDDELKQIVIKFHQFLFLENSEKYKKIKAYDRDENNTKDLNSIILLSGYTIHLQNMLQRNFDLDQMEKQIDIIHNILSKEQVSFDDLQWATRFMRGNLIEEGPLQYEIIHTIPSFLEKYGYNQLIKIHIPANKELNDLEVTDSLEKVDSMIERYYKDINIDKIVYYTESWLLSPELLGMIEEESNIRKFQKHFELIGLKEDTTDFLKFVINNNTRKNTSLQEKIKAYIEEAKQLHLGIGILIRKQKVNKRI